MVKKVQVKNIDELVKNFESDIDLHCSHRIKIPYRNEVYCVKTNELAECNVNNCRLYQLLVMIYENRECYVEEDG